MRGKIPAPKAIRQIKLLRQYGHSLPEIAQITGVPKTTVFRYIKDVKILPEYLSHWTGKRGGSRKRKRVKEERAYNEGKSFIGKLSEREKIILLAVLYWAEGSKKDLNLSNTDPALIRVFVDILRKVCKVDEERIRVSVRIYEDLDNKKCLDYWSKITEIPVKKFVSVNILRGKKKGKLKYGMCRVRVLQGGDLLKMINGIIRAIADGFVPIA